MPQVPHREVPGLLGGREQEKLRARAFIEISTGRKRRGKRKRLRIG